MAAGPADSPAPGRAGTHGQVLSGPQLLDAQGVAMPAGSQVKPSLLTPPKAAVAPANCKVLDRRHLTQTHRVSVKLRQVGPLSCGKELSRLGARQCGCCHRCACHPGAAGSLPGLRTNPTRRQLALQHDIRYSGPAASCGQAGAGCRHPVHGCFQQWQESIAAEVWSLQVN